MDATEKKISKKMKEVNILDKKILKLEKELRILKFRRKIKLEAVQYIYDLHRDRP